MGAAIAALLHAVASVLVQRGHDGLAEYVGFAALLVREGGAVRVKLEQLTTEIETMAAEGRDPTDAELAAVRATRRSLSDRIQAGAAPPSDPDADPPPTG